MNDILYLKEKYLKRNIITLLIEGFFASFAFSLFSQTTVLPVYVSNLTSNTFWISMITFIFFGLSNISGIVSSIIGTNAKSPKWSSTIICGFQRITLFLIFLSTYTVTGSETLSLTVFFISYSLYSISAGMSSPVFNNMVSNVINKNISSFYGLYNISASLAGIISAQLIKYIEVRYKFPINYRILFLFGVIMAVISTIVVIFGVKEVEKNTNKKQFLIKDFFILFRKVIKSKSEFNSILISRIFMAIAEMSVPFYIIKISSIDSVSDGYVGTTTTILLVSNFIFSKVYGDIGDKYGPKVIIKIGLISGFLCSLIAIFMNNVLLGYMLYILVSLSTLANNIGNNISVIIYSKKGLVPIYTAISGLVIAPAYLISSFLGGVIVSKFNLNIIFVLSLISYGLGILINYKNEIK